MKLGHVPECCKYNRPGRHKECTEETCEDCPGCRDHAVFKSATLRKIANGERQRLIRMFAEETQVRAFYRMWRTWLNRWTKQEAMDRLISAMCEEEARWHDHLRLEAESKKKKRKHVGV